MFEIFQVTAEYSNAVLVAIMPYVSDFAKNLDLPITQPITPAHVRFFGCSPRSDHIGGRVVLTNAYEFTFDRGRVVLFRSPNSYFSLSEVERIPEFYGPVRVTPKEVVQVARDTIRKLGYTEAMFHADHPPQVTPPPRSGDNHVSRYRVEWLDPEKPATPYGIRSVTLDLEIDAVTKQIHMLGLLSKATERPDPTIGVRAPVAVGSPQNQLVGGRKVFPVSQAYSNAFLLAILPQINDYIKKAGFDVRLPVTANDVDLSRYDCGLVEEQPRAFLYLKTGERIIYSHGQVICFETADAVRLPENKQKAPSTFYGPVNLSADDAVAMARKAVERLGYSLKQLQLDKKPSIALPRKEGTNTFARYFINWRIAEKDTFLAVAEVDASSKKLKALYVNDRANTNIWRSPPQIDVHPNPSTSSEP
jgi:hypothetical protein